FFDAAPSQNGTYSYGRINLGIVGGDKTDISAHPYQVSVQYYDRHFCGGFLISSTWVVTAAHCLTQGYSTNLNIRAGSSRAHSGGQAVNVIKYVIHSSYSDYTLNNDIALLQLASAVTVANAKAATLPEAGEALADDTSITVTGWGATRENRAGSEDLLQVVVPKVSQTTCALRYPGSITTNMFCAGYLGVGGKDACQGDSGGPASANGKVVGIVSWGTGCANALYPGVYANVASVRNWIRQNSGV
ncbi:trypsin, partial [Diabrotica virgifera virgifera]|uniref:Peptidase S1 domain-containing protein n=1 Tax=Diabrotica virgifera virgifera TaxID=50390 RepID=A0ABM5IAF6_DIAVI